MIHACEASTPEVEAEGLKFKITLNYKRSSKPLCITLYPMFKNRRKGAEGREEKGKGRDILGSKIDYGGDCEIEYTMVTKVDIQTSQYNRLNTKQ